MTAILRTALLAALAAALIPAVAAGQDTSTADLLHRIELLERANTDLERRVRELESLIKSAPSKGRWSEPGTSGGVDGGVLDQPLYAGIGGVTNPELIEATKVPPRYPDAARKAKISGRVTLQAVVKKDGSVGDIQVLQSPDPKFGFVEAAIAAVKQWRYKPAMQNGRPIDVYFTIVVDVEKGQ
jgi:TonB family protein